MRDRVSNSVCRWSVSGALVAHLVAHRFSMAHRKADMTGNLLNSLGVPVCHQPSAHLAQWRSLAGVPVVHTPIGVQPAHCAGEPALSRRS